MGPVEGLLFTGLLAAPRGPGFLVVREVPQTFSQVMSPESWKSPASQGLLPGQGPPGFVPVGCDKAQTRGSDSEFYTYTSAPGQKRVRPRSLWESAGGREAEPGKHGQGLSL